MTVKTALIGFQCPVRMANIGCECNIDVPDEIKQEFEELHGFEYDEFCYYDVASYYPQDELSRDWMYHTQGATEFESAKEIWPYCEVIDDDVKTKGGE